MNSKLPASISRLFLAFEKPFFAFYFSLLVYAVLSSIGRDPFQVRDSAYFNYLADAFLHGQYYLRVIPPSVHDLSFYNGHYYLYWPPMPAIILMPFVALFGVGFSDVIFNLVVAALNVGILALLLRSVDRAGLIRITEEYRGMLVVFFAFGTAHVNISFVGQVWYTAQLLGIMLVGLAYLSAIELKGLSASLVVGLLMGCAMLTRNHLLFTGIWPAYHLISRHWHERGKLLRYIGAALFPPLLLGLWFLSYNYTRFGTISELGIRFHQMAPVFVDDYQKYGAFHPHYVPINFFYQYLHYPFPFDNDTLKGSSLFLLSPVFFYVFAGIARTYRNPNTLLLLASVLVTSIPILLLMGTGWVQYGPRYTLDFTIPLLLLTASGVQDSPPRPLFWLIVLSILQYIPGIYLYIRLGL